MRSWLQRSLWDVVPRDQRMTTAAFRRRQLITAIFVVIGTAVLGVSLRIEPGSVWFYPATIALGLVWMIGAFASGPLHLGRIAYGEQLKRPILSPILIGLALAALFVVGGLIVREIPFLENQVQAVTDHADRGSVPLIAVITAFGGIAEELFFRGAAYASIPRHPVAWTSLAYAVATLATGNVMLGFAAALLGVVVGLERRASGGILAPALTHITWSLSMLFVLPVLFN